MRVGTVAYADEQIQKQQERAANKTTSNKQPLILYFYDGLEVLFRPLYDFNGCIIANKHFKWSENSPKIDAICAKEIGKPCVLCQRAEEDNDRDLKAKESWYLPVYVHQVTRSKDQKTGKLLPAPEIVTYEEDGVKKAVKGIRLIEFQMFGAIYNSFKYFRNFMADPDNGKMINRDFKLCQDGKGKGQKAYITDKKDPKPRPDIAQKTPSLERVFQRLIEALPPVIAGGSESPAPTPSAAPDTTPTASSDDLGELNDYEF